MAHRIAVEGALTQVVQELRARGYDVIELRPGSLPPAEAYVVSGQEDQFMGHGEALTRAPVITAAGRTAAEVAADLHRRLPGAPRG